MHEKDGDFALLLAVRNGHEAIVRMLLDAGADAKQVSCAECRGAELVGFVGAFLSKHVMMLGYVS